MTERGHVFQGKIDKLVRLQVVLILIHGQTETSISAGIKSECTFDVLLVKLKRSCHCYSAYLVPQTRDRKK